MSVLYFGDYRLNDFCDYIFLRNTESSPKRVYEEIEVPGRNGKLLLDSKYYQNVPREYTVVIASGDVEGRRDLFINVVQSMVGYRRLYDADRPDVYTMAKVMPITSMKYPKNRRKLKFVLTFDRVPQWFVIDGEQPITLDNPDSVYNPTLFQSQPLIRIYGNGTLTIGTQTVTVTGNTNAYVDVDSEIMNCFYGTTNLNSKVALSGHEFPVLEPGNNSITYTGITAAEIVPRWWTL